MPGDAGADRDGRRQTARRFYDRWAAVYDLLATRAPLVGGLRRAVVDALNPAPGDVVVEMGCGTGANLPRLRERVGPAGTVVGVDLSPGMLARARGRVARAGWANVHVVRADATRPAVAAADAVLATFVSGMLADADDRVADWVDLVGPGGRVALLDLAHSTEPPGRVLNPAFDLLVRAGTPAGADERYGPPPGAVLDRRVAAAHRAVLRRCSEPIHRTPLGGFARISGGVVSPPD